MAAKTLSDFMAMPIIRNDNIAEVIIDTYPGPEPEWIGKPIRLIGFQTDASKSDFTIREEAYHHNLTLIDFFDNP